MFPPRRPVPSTAALRVLRQLAYISSGTACGAAALVAEERRRHITVAKRVAENARKIKQHPRYAHAAAAVAPQEQNHPLEHERSSYDLQSLERTFAVLENGEEITRPRFWLDKGVATSHDGPQRRSKRRSSREDPETARSDVLPSQVEKGYTKATARPMRPRDEVPASARSFRQVQQTSQKDDISREQKRMSASQLFTKHRGIAPLAPPAPPGQPLQSTPRAPAAPKPRKLSADETFPTEERAKVYHSLASQLPPYDQSKRTSWMNFSPGDKQLVAKRKIIVGIFEVFQQLLPIPIKEAHHKPNNIATNLLGYAAEVGLLHEVRSLSLWLLSENQFRQEHWGRISHNYGMFLKFEAPLQVQESCRDILLHENFLKSMSEKNLAGLKFALLFRVLEGTPHLPLEDSLLPVFNSIPSRYREDFARQTLLRKCTFYLQQGWVVAAAELFMVCAQDLDPDAVPRNTLNEIAEACMKSGELIQCNRISTWIRDQGMTISTRYMETCSMAVSWVFDLYMAKGELAQCGLIVNWINKQERPHHHLVQISESVSRYMDPICGQCSTIDELLKQTDLLDWINAQGLSHLCLGKFRDTMDEIFNSHLAAGELDQCKRIFDWADTHQYLHPHLFIDRLLTASVERKRNDILFPVYKVSLERGHSISQELYPLLARAFTDTSPSVAAVLLTRHVAKSVGIGKLTAWEPAWPQLLERRWKATHRFASVETMFEDMRRLASNGVVGPKLYDVMIGVCIRAGHDEDAHKYIRQMQELEGLQLDLDTFGHLLLNAAMSQRWEAVTSLVVILNQAEVGGSATATRRAQIFNPVLREYAKHHSPEEVWKFTAEVIDRQVIKPTVATSEIVLEAFVKGRNTKLIPYWIRYLNSSGFELHISPRIALVLIRTFYHDFKPSHRLLMWLVRSLSRRAQSLMSEELTLLLRNAIGYDIRKQRGSNKQRDDLHAKERLRALEHAGGTFIPSPRVMSPPKPAQFSNNVTADFDKASVTRFFPFDLESESAVDAATQPVAGTSSANVPQKTKRSSQTLLAAEEQYVTQVTDSACPPTSDDSSGATGTYATLANTLDDQTANNASSMISDGDPTRHGNQSLTTPLASCLSSVAAQQGSIVQGETSPLSSRDSSEKDMPASPTNANDVAKSAHKDSVSTPAQTVTDVIEPGPSLTQGRFNQGSSTQVSSISDSATRDTVTGKTSRQNSPTQDGTMNDSLMSNAQVQDVRRKLTRKLGLDSLRTKSDMLVALTLGRPADAIELYKKSLSADGLPHSSITLDIAIESSLRVHGSMSEEANAINVEADEAGMNISSTLLPVLVNHVKKLGRDKRQNMTRMRSLISNFYKEMDKNQIPISHHVAVTAADLLIVTGSPKQGLDLLREIYHSSWTTARSFDIVAMTVFMKGYGSAEMLHQSGMQWVVDEVLSKDLRIERRFLDALKTARTNVLRHSRTHNRPHETTLLSSLDAWYKACVQRQHAQIRHTERFGNDLVKVLVQCAGPTDPKQAARLAPPDTTEQAPTPHTKFSPFMADIPFLPSADSGGIPLSATFAPPVPRSSFLHFHANNAPPNPDVPTWLSEVAETANVPPSTVTAEADTERRRARELARRVLKLTPRDPQGRLMRFRFAALPPRPRRRPTGSASRREAVELWQLHKQKWARRRTATTRLPLAKQRTTGRGRPVRFSTSGPKTMSMMHGMGKETDSSREQVQQRSRK